MLILTGTVGEGDVPHCRISVRNIIGSRIEECLHYFVQVLSGAPTAVHLLLAVDPFTFKVGSREHHINYLTETITNSWECHINGPAYCTKSVDDPFVFERGSTVAFEECCNAEITESVADLFVPVEGSTAAFDEYFDALHTPGIN